MNSIVIFGGSFNPPHLGHKMIVEYINKLELGKIVIIPNKNPYYKKIEVSDNDRINMLKLMFNNDIDLTEINNEVYTPTSDTIKRYKIKYDKIYFVVGSDSYNDLKTWHNYEFLLENVTFIVFEREHMNIKRDSDIFINNKVIDISSTKCRENIDPNYLTREVYNYIIKKGLYAKKNS